jgi:uncharacterized protein
MLTIFTKLADLIAYQWLGLEQGSRLGSSVHFFIEDVTKIYALLIVMIYGIGWLRASLNTERVRDYLVGKHRFWGYLAGSGFGAVTPFCSCSSIPLFLGFTQAGIPLGITMAFLITSPIINEVAIVLLGSLLGIRFMFVYVGLGLVAGILGGFILDAIKAERFLTPLVEAVRKAPKTSSGESEPSRLSFRDRHEFAKGEFQSIFSRVWKWVLIGVGLGALLHGFVPESFIVSHLGSGQWWSVPGAVLLGIPLYSNASGIIPVAESLLGKGLPVGTTLAFMMSTVAASFPEFMLLKQVMQPRLLLYFFMILLSMFTLVGWILNAMYF